MRHRGAGTFALGQLLWKQGVIWFLLATSAELMPVVRPAGIFIQLFAHH